MDFAGLFDTLGNAGLVAALSGLAFVGASFLVLIGINVFEQISGRQLGRPLPKVHLTEDSLPHVVVQIDRAVTGSPHQLHKAQWMTLRRVRP